MATPNQSQYRIAPSITGIGWVSVSKLVGSIWKHLSSFKAQYLAEDFIEDELKSEVGKNHTKYDHYENLK